MVGPAPHWHWQFGLHFHNFNFHFLRKVLHESFVFTSSTSRFWGKSRIIPSFSHVSHLQLQLLVVYARDSGRAKLRFAAKNVPRKMDWQGLPCHGSLTGPARGRSWSDRPRIGTDSSGFIFTSSTFIFLGEVSHEGFVFTSSTFSFWGWSSILSHWCQRIRGSKTWHSRGTKPCGRGRKTP